MLYVRISYENSYSECAYFYKKNIYTTGKFLFSDLNYTLIHIRMLWEFGAIVQ